MKRRYKRLPIPRWADSDELYFEVDPLHDRIDPVFNKPGLYLDRATKKVWVECRHGAFQVYRHTAHFLYTINQLNHRPLRDSEREHIRALLRMKSKAVTEHLKNLFRTDAEWRILRNIRRNIRT